MKNIYLNSIILFLLITLFSCGKKDTTKNTVVLPPPLISSIPTAEKITSRFIDSPVYGLDVLGDDGIKKQTDGEGKFECNVGEIVKFFIAKNLYIGESICNEKIFINQLGTNDPEVTNRISSLLLRLNRNISSPTTLIDITDLNEHDPINLQSYFSSAVLDSSIYSNINNILNNIKNSDSVVLYTNESNYTSLKNAASTHISNSILNYSSIRSSEVSVNGSLSNWIDTKASSGIIIDLVYGNVYPTVVASNIGSYCPSGLGALGVSLTSENLGNNKAYYLNTLGYTNGIRGVLSKNRILSERATNIFNIPYGSDLMLKGAISLLLNSDSQSIRGVIKLNYIQSNTSTVARCEYSINF